MNYLTIILLWVLSTLAYADEPYMILPIDYIHDGDTYNTHISEYRLPKPLNQFSIRVKGIDTPEMPAESYITTGKLGRAKCIKEAELAIKAKVMIEQLSLQHTKMYIYNFEYDKYGGRILGRVTIGGTDVAELLIREGLAVPYNGEAKIKDWCN